MNGTYQKRRKIIQECCFLILKKSKNCLKYSWISTHLIVIFQKSKSLESPRM